MKPPPFDYVRPASTAEAVEVLAADEDARPLAGGQSLLPMMNFRLARPSTLVDIGRLPGLADLHRDDGVLVIGAATRQRTVETSPLVARSCPLLAAALRHVGHHQIRTRGTLGGSLAHADPAAELGAAAVALDAEVVATGPAGERTLPAAELVVAPYQTSLRQEEVLTATRWPVRGGQRHGFAEIARRAGDFALAGVAAVLELDGAEVARARLVGLGIGGTVRRLPEAEQALHHRPLTDESIDAAAEAAAESVDPPEDVHADTATRRAALRAAARRALEQTCHD
ncbi:xanthine dehydrogenase family protein subunit M [Saccharopolyspora rhizosphaerae]|uniref:Xanthine dehydrogenase family protein subunit M n=1 Tax=Saccharopolyspora rhizosphaerae TaxID=2492662 RepID=A0A426K5D5_9PSEU|nr:xanthine dehydrogenase family protein subunit M [Saccharopolyspora rhizosphaerae]RRO20620.1 xanthine dehydrogenase family protein subunit M [Saccharopolyspora rhizosphaerae]